MKVILGISNRHVHLNKEGFEKLFGKGHQLKSVKSLNQPNQFVSDCKVSIKTNNGILNNFKVVGGLREYTQIEISKTDALELGINPPTRQSGDLENSEVVTLVGPIGEFTTVGCIIADRHIHITSEQKKAYGLNDTVNLLINNEKNMILTDVHLKISDDAYYELHLDTDDANNFELKNGDFLEIINTK